MHTGPGWFAANMGLGIASILIYNLPYSFRGLQEIGIAVFVLNFLLFVLLLSLTITRYAVWPRLLPLMLYHPTQAFFLGTFPMGAVTLVEIVVLGLIPRLGQSWLYVAWVSWWICAAVTIVVAIGVPFITQTRQTQRFEHITGVWFLPVVSPVVCASAGSIVANAMIDAGVLAASQGLPDSAASWYSHARVQEIACYILLGIGLIPSLLWMPIYLARLYIHKLPTAVIVSSFVPVGCCGQGAFALLHIGRSLRRITVLTGATPLGGFEDGLGDVISPTSALAMADAIYALSQVGGLFLWGLGIVWMTFAVLSIADVLAVSEITLNLGLWASTFPVGTMAASAVQMGIEFDSTAFKIIGTVLSVIVIIDVAWIASITAWKGWTGELFHAQDLEDIGGEVPTSLPQSRKYAYQPRPVRMRRSRHSSGDVGPSSRSRSASSNRTRVNARAS
ncbi:Plasma membrane sulfite pump involved in sulfite metabolism [Tilletia horrida]|nr:Plasma membrane sulfite pump involved in sulfite metabolism [Tilletia horrida]